MRKKNILYLFIFHIVTLLFSACNNTDDKPKLSFYDSISKGLEDIVIVGTYTNKESKLPHGFHAYTFEKKSGKLKYSFSSPKFESPSFLTIHPNRKIIYVVSESGGTVSSYRINLQKKNFELISIENTGGISPCHISLDNTGKYLLVSNYGSGNVAFLKTDSAGKLSKVLSLMQHKGSSLNAGRQEAPHAHSAIFSPNNKYVYAADLGIDKIMIYKCDLINNKLISTELDALTKLGGGPRHSVLHPNKPLLYVVDELAGMVEVFKIDTLNGALKNLQQIECIQNTMQQAASADIHIHPTGKFLYVSNRADNNNIAIFSIDTEGFLKPIGYQSCEGKTPRNFCITNNGEYLLVANQDTDNLVVFRINQQNGMLIKTGFSTYSPSPVCLKFL